MEREPHEPADKFTASRLKKLRKMLDGLSPQGDAPVQYRGGEELIDVFRLTRERLNLAVGLLTPYVLTHTTQGRDWINVSVQGRNNRWWASYFIFLYPDRQTGEPNLSMTFVEPSESTGTPSASTLTVTELGGVREFAAWNRLDWLVQLVIQRLKIDEAT